MQGAVLKPSMYCRGCSYVLDGLPETRCPECGLDFDPALKRTYRTRPHRWWVRPGRRLLARITVLGLVLLAVMGGMLYRRYRIERQGIALVRMLGGQADTMPLLPDWVAGRWERLNLPQISVVTRIEDLPPTFSDEDLAQLAGLCYLEHLDLHGTSITDKGLARLRDFKRLRHLILAGCTRVTCDGMSGLEALVDLESLSLAGTRVTNESLVYLSGMNNLRSLGLAFTRVGDAGLAHLKVLSNLRDLTLDYTLVSDEGLPQLQALPNLENLSLRCAFIEGRGLAHVGRLVNLRSLCVSWTNVTDHDLPYLKQLPRLESLDLGGTDITDEGVDHLKELKGLQYVRLFKTFVTKKGDAELATAVPGLQIGSQETRREYTQPDERRPQSGPAEDRLADSNPE